jgi:serine/threonine protein kinase
VARHAGAQFASPSPDSRAVRRLHPMSTARRENPSVADPVVGSLLAGRYRLDAIIGTGGMATVFRATDQSLGRTVAIKLLRRDLVDARDVRRREVEVRTVASLVHPGVVTLFDAVAEDDGGAFLVFQYVDGPDLRARLEHGPLGADLTASVGADLADALAYVHGRGVIHRDLKPGNVLLQPGHGHPRAMLADFGIAQLVDGARLTTTGVLGTAAYLSPEQALGASLTPATDVYSLGLVLIECLSGRRPFPGSGLETAAARLSAEPPLPEGVGGAWVDLLRSMTEREPSARPPATTAADRLRAIAAGAALDPTLLLPAAETPAAVRTERLAATDATTQSFEPSPTVAERAPTKQQRAVTTGRTRTDRHEWLRAAVSVAAVAALSLGIWGLSKALAPVDTAAPVDYPAVGGDLGVSLELLQRSVTP